MTDAMIEKLHAWLAEHEQEQMDFTQAMLRVPSIKGAPADGAPFGQEVGNALGLALTTAASHGMRTENLDGYCGFAEFGSGDRLVVALGHLDVVPVGPGWNHEPFGAEIDGEYLFSRGAIDDKGPTLAAYQAARAVMACMPDLPARVRIVFGCDEESGMACAKHYVKHAEAHTFGFTPDAAWPVVHGEKGISDYFVRATPPEGDFRLVHIEGGQAPNVVIDRCTAKVAVAPAIRSEIEAAIRDNWDRNLTIAWDGDTLLLDGIGKAAHGSTPWAGDSAAARVLRFLHEAAPLSVKPFYTDLFRIAHISGVGLGIHGRDEPSGDLTCNIGLVRMVDDNGPTVELVANIRYPVTWTQATDVQARMEGYLATLPGGARGPHRSGSGTAFRLVEVDDSPPLWFPADHPLVQTILEVHRAETGEDLGPMVMGGGTYAREVPNTVSIGTGWPGDGGAHQTDERIRVSSLHRMARIYAHLIYRLATTTATA